MKPIQTEEQIEENFLAKRAACKFAEEEILQLAQVKKEHDMVMAIQAQTTKEQQIRSLYAAYLESMRGKYQHIMPIDEWYSQYRSLVIHQCW
jgi:hypothetical protein